MRRADLEKFRLQGQKCALMCRLALSSPLFAPMNSGFELSVNKFQVSVSYSEAQIKAGFYPRNGQSKCLSYGKSLRMMLPYTEIFLYTLLLCRASRARSTTCVIAFDEEERILIVSFLPKSLSRVLWTSATGIDRDARRFQGLGAILDWLTGTYSLDLMC